MRVALAVLESWYQNSLSLDYLRLFALEDNEIRSRVSIENFVFPPGTDQETAVTTLLRSDPHVVGLCTYLWNIQATHAVVKRLKAEKPDLLVLLGGMEVSYDAPDILAQHLYVDAVVQGEGEIPFREILRNFSREGKLRPGLPGVWWREQGFVHPPGTIQIVSNLDDLPSPFQSVDANTSLLTGDVLYESYRGCVFSCAFCLYHRDYTRQRYYSMERVRNDLKVLLDSPCQSIRFVDATFNINPRRTREILTLLEGNGKRVSVEVSAEFFDAETIKMFPRAGIRQVDIGLQSTTPEALDTVNRKFFRVGPFIENLSLLRAHQAITLNIELIVGLPNDNYESFKRSLNFAVSQRPDHVSIYRLLLLKGSEVRRRAVEHGMKFDPDPPYALLESTGFGAADLARLEILSFAHILLYNSGVPTWALRLAVRQGGLEPTDIYEHFLTFCSENGDYSEPEMRELARWYAVGNRFDSPRPPSFSLDRVYDVSFRFFRWLGKLRGDADSQVVFDELIDYGYRLARLDFVRESAMPPCAWSHADRLKLSQGAEIRNYSQEFFDRMHILGQNLGHVAPQDAAGVAFFCQSGFGPTALTVNRDLYQVLLLCNGECGIAELACRLDAVGYRVDKSSISMLQECLEELVMLGLLV